MNLLGLLGLLGPLRLMRVLRTLKGPLGNVRGPFEGFEDPQDFRSGP